MSEPLYTEADVETLAATLADCHGSRVFWPLHDTLAHQVTRDEFRRQSRRILDALTAAGWRKLPDGKPDVMFSAESWSMRNTATGDTYPMFGEADAHSMARTHSWRVPQQVIRSRTVDEVVATYPSPSTGEDPKP